MRYAILVGLAFLTNNALASEGYDLLKQTCPEELLAMEDLARKDAERGTTYTVILQSAIRAADLFGKQVSNAGQSLCEGFRRDYLGSKRSVHLKDSM